jgi:NRPS condensation-like uncharacterized protein
VTTRSTPAVPKDFFFQRGRGTGTGSGSDQQIRLVLRFGGLLDLALLRRAVRAVVERDPILRARFVESEPFVACWELREGEETAPEVELEEVAEAAPAMAAFLADTTIRDGGPYWRLRVVRAAGRDALCVRVDHRLCDGAGAKALAGRLAEAYRCLAAGAPLPPPREEFAPRTVAGITGRERPSAEPPPPPPSRPLSWSLPRGGYRNEQPAHAVRVIGAETVAVVRKAGKPLGATLTDIVLAALVRAMHPHRVEPPGAPLLFLVSSDARGQLPPGAPEVLCNLFQHIFPEVRGSDPTHPFRETLAEVAASMGAGRAKLSLEEALAREAAFAHVYQRFASARVHAQEPREREATMMIVSNVGVLDEAKLDLGSPPLLDAQLLGTVTLAREILVCASSFRGALTLSIGYCRSDLPAAVIEGILERLAAELEAFAAER